MVIAKCVAEEFTMCSPYDKRGLVNLGGENMYFNFASKQPPVLCTAVDLDFI